MSLQCQYTEFKYCVFGKELFVYVYMRIYVHMCEEFFSKTWSPNLALASQWRFLDWCFTRFGKELRYIYKYACIESIWIALFQNTIYKIGIGIANSFFWMAVIVFWKRALYILVIILVLCRVCGWRKRYVSHYRAVASGVIRITTPHTYTLPGKKTTPPLPPKKPLMLMLNTKHVTIHRYLGYGISEARGRHMVGGWSILLSPASQLCLQQASVPRMPNRRRKEEFWLLPCMVIH